MVQTRHRLWVAGTLLAVLAVAAIALLVTRDREAPRPVPQAVKPKPVANQHFHSRPDLAPPVMPASGRAGAPVLLAPKRSSGQSGPAILDARGKLVWFHPVAKGTTANDFRVQRYRGRPVLTWWEGKMGGVGYGSGTWVIADTAYREIARVRAGNGLQGDLHEMQLTARGTALIGSYHAVAADLSAFGSVKHGRVLDCVIQEVDVRTGKVVWDWHSVDHVALGESYVTVPRTAKTPMDYFHINSIDEEPDGNLLVSARNTWALYEIDRSTGAVLWRLGGRRSDFALGAGVRFAWQHDARRQADGTITLFDNEATPKVRDESRVLTLKVDARARTVSVSRALTHPAKVLSFAEGNAERLPNGGMFVGWGLGRRASEIGPKGRLRFDVRLPADTDSYRAVSVPWRGRPVERPAVVVKNAEDFVTAYASWNGATGITSWRLLAGPSPRRLRGIATRRVSGFETAIRVKRHARWFAVRALVGHRVVATSAAVRGR